MKPKNASGGLWKRFMALPIRAVAIPLLCLALLAGAAAYRVLRVRMESAWEQMDRAAMDAAAAAAAAMLAWGPPQEETYWFDAAGFAMIPATEPPPAAYGEGTARRGGADAAEGYDPGQDYRGKVLRVTFAPQSGEAWRTELEWVSVP